MFHPIQSIVITAPARKKMICAVTRTGATIPDCLGDECVESKVLPPHV
jgi:hypothetical protein